MSFKIYHIDYKVNQPNWSDFKLGFSLNQIEHTVFISFRNHKKNFLPV